MAEKNKPAFSRWLGSSGLFLTTADVWVGIENALFEHLEHLLSQLTTTSTTDFDLYIALYSSSQGKNMVIEKVVVPAYAGSDGSTPAVDVLAPLRDNQRWDTLHFGGQGDRGPSNSVDLRLMFPSGAAPSALSSTYVFSSWGIGEAYDYAY